MRRTPTITTGTGAVGHAINCGSVDINDPGANSYVNRPDHRGADLLALDLGGGPVAVAGAIAAGDPSGANLGFGVDHHLSAVALNRNESMSAKLEKVAAIKGQIAKACNEIEHGDTSAAVLALANGLSALLTYVVEQEEAAFGFGAPKSRMLKK